LVLVMEIHDTSADAVQEQLRSAVTATVPGPPAAVKLAADPAVI
jgi:hypothetical protein